AFTAENGRFDVHTRWIETEFDHRIPPYDGPVAEAPEPAPRERITVEVGGKRLEVVLPAGLGNSGRTSGPADRRPPRRGGGRKATSVASGDALTAPMQGTLVKVAVEDGQRVQEGDLVAVLEAMTMEQAVNAHKACVVTG